MSWNLHKPRSVVAGLLMASSLGTAMAQGAGADAVVAQLGEISVRQAEVERLLQALPEAERAAVRANRPNLEAWLRQRLASEALLQEAQRKKWGERPEVRARVDAATREITSRIVATSYLESVVQLPAGYPSDAEVAQAYTQGKAQFQLPATYRVAQIFVAASTPDAGQQAKALAVQARAGDFAALARSRSDDQRSAASGGEVGTLALDRLLPEVRSTVAQLKVGEVSDAVSSSSGFHVLKLLDAQPARAATLDEMKPQLQAALRRQRQQQMVQEHLATLAPTDRVTVHGAALDAALMQVH